MGNLSVDSLNLDMTIFTQIANNAVEHYAYIANPSVRLLNYSENATFLVESLVTREKYILRVGRPGYHTKPEVEGEIQWLKTISANSLIEAALPLLGSNGEYVQVMSHENTIYLCVLFEFLDGSAPDENHLANLVRQFDTLGELTAQLHAHSFHHRKSLKQITRPVWDYETILGDNPKWGRWQDGLGITAERMELFERVSAKIKRRLSLYGKCPHRYGFIHSDLRLANLLMKNDHIQVIDFDDCGFSWYLFDLATSLSFMEHKPYVPSLISAWVNGYKKFHPLSLEEEQEIPTFVMMRRLQLIAWIGSRDNETTRALGVDYTEETDRLAQEYLDLVD